LPEEFNGQRSLVGYSPWSCKQSEKFQKELMKTWGFEEEEE